MMDSNHQTNQGGTYEKGDIICFLPGLDGRP